ncbi:formimidoylglutamase [Luteimonas wenzhouensis]|uniref:Formimidoylglutamase n=1 Tax=Luteimonas wenzhouensis TaxID=2599615 RepID=A0A5C5TS32_9GAMM|nr:formimidoylglutamase [Luteimonas wenzhouensis]TWT16814.1 formimidoylglutamase [Luteimonas wenzhouensis]
MLSQAWQGRIDSTCDEAAFRWHQVVREPGPGQARGIALAGFACDEGIRRNGGRPGAAAGPEALRVALSNLPAIAALPLYDAGDVGCVGDDLERAQERHAERVGMLLDDGHFPIGLGGGHEIGYASYLGLAGSALARGRRIAIVNLDAHFDLRESARANSGTPFLQAIRHAADHGIELDYICLGISESANTRRLFDTVERVGARYLLDRELTPASAGERIGQLLAWLEPAEFIYLSLCLDVLPACIAPGVSAPSARGVGIDVVEDVIAAVMATGRVALCDIAELSPPFDRDGMTARVAARLAYRMAAAKASTIPG